MSLHMVMMVVLVAAVYMYACVCTCSCVCVCAVIYLTQLYWSTLRYFCLLFHFYEQLADREVRHEPGALRKWCWQPVFPRQTGRTCFLLGVSGWLLPWVFTILGKSPSTTKNLIRRVTCLCKRISVWKLLNLKEVSLQEGLHCSGFLGVGLGVGLPKRAFWEGPEVI